MYFLTRNGFDLPVCAYIKYLLAKLVMEVSERGNVLVYSLAFGSARLSSATAKVVAEPARSRVARMENCIIAR